MRRDTKKNIIAIAVMAVVVILTGFVFYKIGWSNSTTHGQEAMENEIRLVQEHTAEKVMSLFLDIPEVRDALEKTTRVYFSCRIHWWNFDRQLEIVRFGKTYQVNWWELAR